MGHIHAAAMVEYAKDAMETDKPWERWEFSINNERGYVLSYDGENYCEVIVDGRKEVIKSSKIYATPSRSDSLTEDQLSLLVKYSMSYKLVKYY